MPDESELQDNPQARVADLLRRTGTVSPWDFSRLTDEAITHAGQATRVDAQASGRPWRPLGPRNLGGRIRSLAQDERNPRVLYAGSGQGGLWKTDDAGDSWRILDDFRPPNVRQGLPIGAIGVSYSNPQIIYVGTGEPTRSQTGGDRDIPGNGLYWSTNAGNHFQQLDPPDVGTGSIGAGQYESIVVDPWEPKRFWIATPDRGLARGTPQAGTPRLQRDDVDAVGAPAAGTQRASDVIVDFGPSRSSPPATVRVYAALWGNGIYRAVYNRSTDSYQLTGGVAWTRITPAAFPAGITRIKLALCRARPQWIAAVAGIAGDSSSNVFLSNNRGNAGSWVDTGARPGDTGTQARYDLVLGMHPADPSIFVTGSVELFRGDHNAGAGTTAWTKIITWTRHDRGDRAQHGDQHALLFDIVNPRRLWVGNDGGLSSTPDLGGRWRERGLGINAAQFYDLTTHPLYPYIFGGGLQDNGTWLSYGGQSWYHLMGGDGGEIGFDPNDLRRLITTHQGSTQAGWVKTGLNRTIIQTTTATIGAPASPLYLNRLPDVPLNGAGQEQHLEPNFTRLLNTFSNAHTGPFVGVVAHHPSNSNHALAGRKMTAYLTTDGNNFIQINNLPAFNPADSFVSKIAYASQNPDTNWWIATDQGELFFTNDANATAWASRAPATIAGANITAIAIHPSNDSIIAIAVALRGTVAGSRGRVFISGDAGQNWCEISGRTAPCNSSNANQLNPTPASALVFDPSSPNAAASAQTLYCGCLAGVYVIRNAIAPTAAGTSFTPQWRTFNNGLPLTLIFDLEIVRYNDGDGAAQQLLRCATHARGAYECDLAGAPAVRLLMRDNIVDDGRSYAAAHRVPNNHDPRMTPGASAVMVLNRAIDIRIDTPPYRFLGQTVDGLELDELLRSDTLAAGKVNVIYVQVHNVGAGSTNGAQVHLFWAQDTGAPAGAPDLQASFWNEFPNVAAGGTWQLVDSQNISMLRSGRPHVLAFRWNVPATLSGQVSLLAVCTDASNDALDGAALGNVVDPGQADSFIGNERRTMLYATEVQEAPADALLRDGFDDQGNLGETAWGVNSHDIIVLQAAATPDPETAFAQTDDRRASDVVDGTVTNHIYVRVNNRGGQNLTGAQVEVFRIPIETPHEPATWVSLGSVTMPAPASDVAGNSARIAPVITWNGQPDPAPHRFHLLAALVTTAADPRPDYEARIDSIASFWQLFLESVDSGNAALRAITWQA